ncbi:MAG: hypothetical protein GXP26_10825 [Planctomycetes bacterium]|nr:hypothetical protein [Planctomycetota bacterium]
MFGRIVTRKWISVLVLTLGLGAAWSVGVALIGAIGMSLMPSAVPGDFEDIIVAADGTPLIKTRVGGNWNNTKLRTLDGEAVEQEGYNWLGQASIRKPYQKPRWFESPITWRERIAGVNDEQKPPMSWVAIRDGERPGHAYFAGYDPISKRRIGYLGRAGFRPSIPARDEWFDMGNSTLSWQHQPIASRNSVQYGGLGYLYGRGTSTDKNRLAWGLCFMIDGREIQELDLANRRVRTLTSLDGLRSLGIVSQPLPSIDEDAEAKPATLPGDENADSLKAQSPFRLASMQVWSLVASPGIDAKHKTADRILACCDDRLVVINPFDNSQQAFSLPEQLRESRFSAYSMAEDQLLLTVERGKWESGRIFDLLWIDTEGKVVQEKNLRLLGGRSTETPMLATVGVSIVAPSLLPWLVGVFGVMPVAGMNIHQAESLGAALGEILPLCWPVLVLLLGLSVIFARLTYKWQQKYCRENTVLWCVTVFLFTWPALMAYWVMHRRPMMEACGECSAEVPRDRDACARCETEFAEPGRLGTEVFA